MMYTERKKRFNWKGFILKLILLFLVIFLVIKLLPSNTKIDNNNGYSNIFNSNFTKFKEVGNNYFNKDNLPLDGKQHKVTLKQLIKEKRINSLKDKNNNKCNEGNSYINAYKKNIGYELEVYLECGEEKDTSYIYLGCFNDCQVTTKKSTSTSTTTIKKNNNEEKTTVKSEKTTTSSDIKTTKKVEKVIKTTKDNYSKNVNNTTRTTTVQTTRIQKYAVIFNANGGTKTVTQHVVKGASAIKPTNPTKKGFVFKGWYLDGKEYDFNTSVYNNIILMAKWEIDDTLAVGDKTTKTFNETVYSALLINKNNTSVGTKINLKIPDQIKTYSNIKVKSVIYIRNFVSNNDVNKMNIDNYTIDNFGQIDNIEIVINDKLISWKGLVKSSAKNPINNICGYGIVVRVVWQYDV